MGAIFQSLNRTIIAGFVLLIVIVLLTSALSGTTVAIGERAWWMFFVRWLHVLAGVM